MILPNVFLFTLIRERQYFYQGVQILTSKETKSIVGLFLDFTYVILKGPNKRFNRKKTAKQKQDRLRANFGKSGYQLEIRSRVES